VSPRSSAGRCDATSSVNECTTSQLSVVLNGTSAHERHHNFLHQSSLLPALPTSCNYSCEQVRNFICVANLMELSRYSRYHDTRCPDTSIRLVNCSMVGMATKIISDFRHKIGYNYSYTVQMLPRSKWVSGPANLMASVKLCSDDPCCHGKENLDISQKICHNSGYITYSRNFWFHCMVFGSAN